jgi:hypothetical protein
MCRSEGIFEQIDSEIRLCQRKLFVLRSGAESATAESATILERFKQLEVETKIKDVGVLFGVCGVFFDSSVIGIEDLGGGDIGVKIKAEAYGEFNGYPCYVLPCTDPPKSVHHTQENYGRSSSLAFEDPKYHPATHWGKQRIHLFPFESTIDLAILLCEYFREDSENRTELITALKTMKTDYQTRIKKEHTDAADAKRMAEFRKAHIENPASIPVGKTIQNRETEEAGQVDVALVKRKKELAIRNEFPIEVRKMKEFKLFVDAVKSLTLDERFNGILDKSTYLMLTRMEIDVSDI